MKKLFTFSLFLIIAIVLTACSGESDNAKSDKEDKLNVYTTVYPLSYFTERIGGDYVNVTSIYPTGVDEHTFEPTQKDMMALADADLFFYIGLGLEGFVDTAQDSLKDENVKMVAASNNITDEQLSISTGEEHADHEDDAATEGEATDEHAGHDHSGIDPHVWLSPVLAKDLALTIKDELVTALPEQKSTFNANYEKLVSELDALNADYEKMASEVSTKTFFVSHAAYGYIAGQYGLQQVSVAGLNSQDEPSQKELAEIVDLAKESNIHYILFEQNVNSNLTSVIQKEVGAKALTLHNLGTLTEEDVKNNETYFSLMEKNIDTLKKALNP